MGVDLPPVTSADISSELNKPQAGEVVLVGVCKSPDFQAQFDELQSQTKEKTAKLQEEMQYSEKQKEVLRNIYKSLGEDNSELKTAIESQSVKIFEVPNRDLLAVSIDGKNVDYLYDLEGKLIVDMVTNLSNEFLPYYMVHLERIGYSILYNNEKLCFKSVDGRLIYDNSDEFYEVLLRIEKEKRKLVNTLKEILKERGVNY